MCAACIWARASRFKMGRLGGLLWMRQGAPALALRRLAPDPALMGKATPALMGKTIPARTGKAAPARDDFR